MIGLSKKLLLCFCLCLGFSAAEAQYRIDQWTADDGLPQNSVYGIAQTDDGYLWLATSGGLAQFDGARFTVFNKSNSPGTVNNRFRALFEDECRTRKQIVKTFSRNEGLTDTNVNPIYEDGDGALLVGTTQCPCFVSALKFIF